MSLARAVLSGTVYRNPEKRFTGNDIPVTTFTINIDEKERSLIKVVARGNNAEVLEHAVSKGDKIVVDGRLQTATVQGEDGSEKKILELDISGFEVVSSNNAAAPAENEQKPEEVVTFNKVDMTNDVLIGDEEIPF